MLIHHATHETHEPSAARAWFKTCPPRYPAVAKTKPQTLDAGLSLLFVCFVYCVA